MTLIFHMVFIFVKIAIALIVHSYGLHNPANAHIVGLDLPAEVFHDLRCFQQLRDFFLR
jgi:hypothetical protein